MCQRIILYLLLLLSSLTSQLSAQRVIRDSANKCQYVLPPGFRINENKTTDKSPMYVDDNGSSISIRFEKTPLTREQYATGMDAELLQDAFAEAIPGYEKDYIRVFIEEGRPGALIRFNVTAKTGDSVFYMTDIIKTYYHEGRIVTLVFMGLKDIFKNYEHLYTQLFSSFTHDMEKTIEPVPFENGKAYMSGPGISIDFPARPVEETINGLPVWQSVDQQEQISYKVMLSAGNPIIGREKQRQQYLKGLTGGYRSSITAKGISIKDTVMNNKVCMFWSSASTGDNTVYTLTTIYGNSFVVFSVIGEEKKLSKAFQRFIDSITPVDPVDMFSQPL